jgi:hypothetical protein
MWGNILTHIGVHHTYCFRIPNSGTGVNCILYPKFERRHNLNHFCADAYFVKNTPSATPRPLYCWKAEELSFFHVLLVLGVNLGILLNKKCQSSSCVSFVRILNILQIHQ